MPFDNGGSLLHTMPEVFQVVTPECDTSYIVQYHSACHYQEHDIVELYYYVLGILRHTLEEASAVCLCVGDDGGNIVPDVCRVQRQRT